MKYYLVWGKVEIKKESKYTCNSTRKLKMMSIVLVEAEKYMKSVVAEILNCNLFFVGNCSIKYIINT